MAWSFETPRLKLTRQYPRGDSVALEPVIVLGFDQRIDVDALLPHLELRSKGRSVGLRAATEGELAADENAKRLFDSLDSDRRLALSAGRRLPTDAKYSVLVKAGAPSAEGPLATTEDQSFDFRTYGPFRVTGHRCGWNDECRPGWPWSVSLSNPIDVESLTPESVRVSPELDDLTVDAHGAGLSIAGRQRANTLYTVTIDGDLRDVFGQALGGDERLKFRVGEAQPQLRLSGDELVVLEPRAARALPVYSSGFETLVVEVHAVEPGDWKAWLDWKRNQRARTRAPLPGRSVVTRTVTVEGAPGELVETLVDLTPALEQGLGHAIVSVTAGKVPAGWNEPPSVQAWVQSTRIGIDALAGGGDELLAWVTNLQDGAPMGGASLRLEPIGTTAKSDAQGLARLPLPDSNGAAVLVASHGRDTAFFPQNRWSGRDLGWQAQSRSPELLWHVFDDRGLYRPGETVRVKGWVRALEGGVRSLPELPGERAAAIDWTLSDPRGNELAKGRTTLTELGGFDLELSLPDDTNLGPHGLRLSAQGERSLRGGDFHRSIEVREFRRPEYEVSARASEGPFFAGGSAEVTVTADYYAGGHLAGASATWRVTQRPGEFRPPGRSDFRFGRWIPWWWEPRPFVRGGVMPPFPGAEAGETQVFEGTTSGLGAHHLKLDFGSPEPPLPVSVTAEATVQDLSRQAFSSTAALLVHPAEVYVGLRTRSSFVEKGEPLDVDVIVVDLDGRAVAGREVVLEAERSKSRWARGGWIEEWVDRLECRPTVGEEPATCTFLPESGGRWRVRALVTDAEGRRNLTEITTWVSGGDALPSLGVEEERVELVPDAQEYRPGTTAKLLVQAPFSPAEGLLTTRRGGLVETRRFRMESPTTVLEVPIPSWAVPNLHAVVELNGEQLRTGADGRPDPDADKRPAFARGAIDLKVPPVDRVLSVAVEPGATETEPGASTSVALEVTGADGEPVADAEVALVVADEAVLALTGYEVLDPLDSFHPHRGDAVASFRSRAWLLLGAPPATGDGAGLQEGFATDRAKRGGMELQRVMDMAPPMAMASMAEGAAGAGGGEPPIALRTNFDPLALFAPALRTDAQGRARVELELPDNLTRYRVFAVAVAGGEQGGTGESSITARLPVMARLQPPRFLNFGDRFELPLLIQNQTASPRTVEVALRAANLGLDDAARTVEVPGHDRIELRFPASADEAGTARVQVAVASGSFADASESSWPVWTPATSEAFATYGEIDEGAIDQPLQVPQEVWPQFGGLEITTSSTALQGLTDAVIYLASYPFDCAEQRASRILAIAALRDVLTAFDAEGLPSPEELEASVRRDLDELAKIQNGDGGFGFWRRGEDSWPFLSVHVVHALARAEAKGYELPPSMRDRGLSYLRGIERTMNRLEWSEGAKRATLAQALFVRELLGDADPKRARRLFEEAGTEELSLEALGWLLPTLHDAGATSEVAAIRRHLLNRVTETASTAEFSTSYGGDGWRLFHSSRRSDAVLLASLIRVEPELDLVPKLARGLLAHRERGRWGSTQENAWVLLALDAWFRRYESATPDFVARAWLGDGLALEQAYRGRSTDRHRADVPMSYLAQGPAERDLIVAKDGPGRLYWRLGLRYAPRSLELEPAAHGFEVARSYEAVDDESDVTRDEDGTWRVKAGTRVRVRVTMAAPGRRYHVALVDPLPAGFEVLDAGLATTGAIPRGRPSGDERPWGWWWGRWYEHENLRDERAEAFSTLLWPGAHSYSYVCRATMPGRFVVPPAKAEEMYAPETFGRSASEVVVIE